jgi:hypothetical protein
MRDPGRDRREFLETRRTSDPAARVGRGEHVVAETLDVLECTAASGAGADVALVERIPEALDVEG